MVTAMTLRAGLILVGLSVGLLSGCGGQDSIPTDAATDFVGFTSPSGTVGYIVNSTYVRYDISDRDWTPPPRPAGCVFDYGQGISLSLGEEAAFVCASDTALGGGKPRDYGQSVSVGLMQCDSTESGITRRDTKTGHGFMIAREAYRVF